MMCRSMPKIDFGFSRYGTSRETGRPYLVMRISSPVSATSPTSTTHTRPRASAPKGRVAPPPVSQQPHAIVTMTPQHLLPPPLDSEL